VKVSFEKVLQDWKRGHFDPVYLFYGEEDFLTDQLCANVIKAGLEPGAEDFNLDILYGNEVDGAMVVSIASAYPMMAARRVVLLKNFTLLSAQSIEMLAKYVKNALPTTCLVLTADKVDLRKSRLAAIEKASTAVESKQLYDRDIPRWIVAHLAERQMTISEDAIRLLHSSVGNSLRSLSSEIDKISLNLAERKNIVEEDVASVTGMSKQFSVFELCDAIGNKNISHGLEILSRMLQLGETPVGILAMLSRHFTILAKLKGFKAQRLGNDDLAKKLNLRPYFLSSYLLQAARYNQAQLRDVFSLLLEADQHLKTSYQKPKLVLEELMFRLNIL